MKKKKLQRILLELTIYSFILFVINFFFAQDPGFFSNKIANPFLILALLASSYYGKFAGFVSLVFSLLLISLPFPYLAAFFKLIQLDGFFWKNLSQQALLPSAVTLVGTFFFGMIRDSMVSRLTTQREVLRKVSRGKGLLQKEIRALKVVNSELEDRLLTQKDSIISLYLRIKGLYTLNLENSLKILLGTVQRFTGAESCSVWEYDQQHKKLILRERLMVDKNQSIPTELPVEDTIEGWVVRNNLMFSIKMVIHNENLSRMDKGRNIYTAPVLAGQKIWGVLNIESLPFEKYNQYTEKLLLVILALVAPPLERAIEYKSIIKEENNDNITGLPSFSKFYIFLEKEVNRMILEKGSLSVVILELLNYPEFISNLGKNSTYYFFSRLVEEIKLKSENKAIFFHYKGDNQISFVYPNMDYDGTSYFCLQVLELINTKTWNIDDKQIFPEIIMGYASLSNSEQTAEDLLSISEHLLEMQRIVRHE
ncbi:MAG: diguanylate cyclase [Spirochaetales bacterium]|nr:diguanylate cyclase [Spirochaetales bacterium]